MISIETSGLDETIRKLKEKSAALRDLTPAWKRFAAELVKKTDDAFQNSRGYDGEAWDYLAQSTIDKRMSKLPGHNRRNKKTGKLTSGARTKLRATQAFLHQERASNGGYGGVIKPLIDTARARNSNHATPSRDGTDWSAVGYLGYHMGGSADGKLPKRNPSPFEWNGSQWVLRESARASLGTHLRNHIFVGGL